jgi:hypothetical protein
MSDDSGATPAPSLRLNIVIGVVLAALVGWFFLRTNTSEAGRECRALFHAARTAADTARIDTTFAPSSRLTSDPRSCGFMRGNAIWR